MGDRELSEDEHRQVVEALRLWAAGHPAAGRPLVMVMGKMLSPKQLAEEMEKRSEFGWPFLKYLAEEAERTGEPVTEPIYRAVKANQSR
jgi:hypothetical protein